MSVLSERSPFDVRPYLSEDTVPMIRAFWNDTNGTTAIEYAVIAAGLSILITGAVTSIGTRLNALFLGPLANNLT